MCLHTLPHLVRPTLNDLQPLQHEKVSSVYVRAQNPPGLTLVPCGLSAVDKRDQNSIESHTPTHTYRATKNEARYSRTIHYENTFFSLGNPRRKGSHFALRARAPQYGM